MLLRSSGSVEARHKISKSPVLNYLDRDKSRVEIYHVYIFSACIDTSFSRCRNLKVSGLEELGYDSLNGVYSSHVTMCPEGPVYETWPCNDVAANYEKLLKTTLPHTVLATLSLFLGA